MEVQTAPTSLHSQPPIPTHEEVVVEHHEEALEHDLDGEETLPPRQQEHHEQYELTELKNMSTNKIDEEEVNVNIRIESPLEELTEDEPMESNTSHGTAAQNNTDDNFLIHLADAVRQHPCIFDPDNEYYANKQSNADFRYNAWKKIAKDVHWTGDLHALQAAWKRLRDRFVRRHKKYAENVQRGVSSIESPLFESMLWLAPHIGHSTSSNERESSATSNFAAGPSTSHVQTQPQSREVFYVEPQSMGQDVMISGYQSQHQQNTMPHTTPQPPHRVQQPSSSNTVGQQQQQPEIRATTGSSSGYYIVRNPNGGGGQAIRIVNNAPDPNSSQSVPTSSAPRVTVVPASRVNGNAVLHLQPGQAPPRQQQRVHIIHTPASSTQPAQLEQRILGASDPGVTVTASGSAGMVGSVKKDQTGGPMSMIIDPTPYFHNGTQKMYRLVNVADLQDGGQSTSLSGPPRKRMAIVARPQQLNNQNMQHQQTMAMTPSSSRAPAGQMDDEVIIDDGIQERTVVIDHDAGGPESPLLSESPGLGSMMISGHQSMNSRIGQPSMGHRGMVQHQQHHHLQQQQHDTGMTGSPGPHPGYLQQSQYDADLQFQQMISTSLSRYDDDTKAMMKFNIQRILLEARYGSGVCLRMMQEEEMSEAPNSGVVSHEMVPQ